MAEGPTILECPPSTGHHLVVNTFSLLIQHYQQTYSTMWLTHTAHSLCLKGQHTPATVQYFFTQLALPARLPIW